MISFREYITENNTKPLAIIIKGNIDRIKTAGMEDHANNFYNSLSSHIKNLGYNVKFDDGLPNTTPDQSAALWVGHSRGVDRLQYAEGPKTVALTTRDNFQSLLKNHNFNDAANINTKDPNHYKLSSEDISQLDKHKIKDQK